MNASHEPGLRASLSLVILVLATLPPAAAQRFVLDGGASERLPNIADGDLAWADYDGDGDPDLAVIGLQDYGDNSYSPSGAIYRNDGGVLVRDNASPIALVADGTLAWADYDGDGDPDLVVTGSDAGGTFVGEVYRNVGGRLVRDDASSAAVADVVYGQVAWGDYDGDGDPDLALTGLGRNDEFFSDVYRNDGGVFVRDAASSDALSDVYNGSLSWGDYDGDGDDDLVLSGYNSGDSLARIYRSDGGTLVLDLDASNALTDATGSLMWVDYDRDGDPDLSFFFCTVTGAPRTCSGAIYRNDAGALVRDVAATAAVVGAGGESAWGDYDGDGDPDLVLTGFGSTTPAGDVYRNDGGVLVHDAVASDAVANVAQSAVAWADYDSDGDLDLALIGIDIGETSFTFIGAVYRNEPSAPSRLPIADAGPDQTVVAGQAVALDGSAEADPDGGPFSFAWTLNGPGDPALSDATAPAPTFCAAAPGAYTATLVVSDGAAQSTPDAALITVISADASLAALAMAVGELGLNRGQTNALVTKLDQARAKLGRGQDPSGPLGAFRNQVAAFVRARKVTATQGAALAGRASEVGAAVATPCGPAVAPARGRALAAAEIELGAPYPNPAAGLVTVPFSVAEAGPVRVVVYDVLGREVARLVDGPSEAGAREARFETGALPAGAYVVRLEAGGAVATARLVVAR